MYYSTVPFENFTDSFESSNNDPQFLEYKPLYNPFDPMNTICLLFQMHEALEQMIISCHSMVKAAF